MISLSKRAMARCLLTVVLSVFLLVCSIAASWARTFEPVGSGRGINARSGRALLMDGEGFLWVGSPEGLFRFDGYAARQFPADPERADSLGDNHVRALFQAADGIIWVGTNAGGLHAYDLRTQSFTRYVHDPENPASIIDNAIYGIAERPGGSLWVSTRKGLSRLDRATGRFENFIANPGQPGALSHKWSMGLHIGQASGSLWIGTVGGGVNRWNPESADFSHFDLAALTGGPEGRNKSYSLYEDPDGLLWVGTFEGLVMLDPGAGTAEVFDLGLNNGYFPLITNISHDKAGRLWMGTGIRGVLAVDPVSREWWPANPDSLGSAGNLPAVPVEVVLAADDTLFVGTLGSGVYRARLEENRFGLLTEENTGGRLQHGNITAISAGDAPGRPWVGSYGGGPQQVDVDANDVLTIADSAGALHESAVLSLASDVTGRRFAGTSVGLFIHDGALRTLHHEQHDPAQPDGLGDGNVQALLPAPGGGMWVGTFGAGLYLRRGDGGEFAAFRHDPAQPDSLSGDFITALLDEGDDVLWAGTRSNGLNRCRMEPWSCERFADGKDDAFLGSHFITDLYRDRRGRLWVATDGDGLVQVLADASGAVSGFRHYRAEQGLLDNSILAIEEDEDESLWLSTRQGLSRFNPATAKVINFVSESGLPADYFNIGASAADDEYIYFGATEGLLSFPKGSLLFERAPSPLRITGATHAAKGEQQEPVEPGSGQISIPYGEMLTIEAAVLDFSEKAHEYAYRLGEDEPWTSLGQRRQVIFHGLAPGSYRFEIRGRDVYGIWGQSEPLSIRVVPPFWMTWWFRFLVIVGLLLLVHAWDRRRAAAKERRANEIQRLGELREHALENALGSEAELAVLTPRQKEVLQLIAEGYTTREISERLNVSVKTVEAHRANLMERLDIRDIPGLVRLAIRSRLVSPHD